MFEPEPGRMREQGGWKRSPIAGSHLSGSPALAKCVRVPTVEACSNAEAEQKAADLVRSLVPADGYRLAVEKSMVSEGDLQGASVA